MQFDTALNLVWLSFGVFAVAGALRARRNLPRDAHRTPMWLHLCGVTLILAALFPFISATDDVLRIQHMDLQHSRGNQHESGKKGPSDSLIRLYETMDTPVVCAVRQISFSVIFVSLIVIPLRTFVSRATPLESGRAPPSLALARF